MIKTNNLSSEKTPEGHYVYLNEEFKSWLEKHLIN